MEIYNIHFLEKKEDTTSNNLSFHHRKLEKEEKYTHKASRRREIIKIRAEVNEIENSKK